MGKTVCWFNVSLDLLIDHEDAEAGAGSWLRIDEELHREFNRRAQTLAAIAQGRVMYEIMESFWPAARHDDSLPDYMREYGEIWTEKPKLLVSRTRAEAQYNTRIVGHAGSALEELAAFRAETEGSIGVGGSALATQLLHAGLLDELLLFVHPVVLGRGRPLFGNHDKPLQMDLVEHRAFSSGVVMMHYALRGRDA
jgi:dihydrofolate reductase